MALAWTAGSYDLITDEDVKELLGGAPNRDRDRLRFCIRSATDIIETFTRRKLKARKHWQEVHDNKKVVVLDNYPLLSHDDIRTGFDVKRLGVATTLTADSGSKTTLVDAALTEADDYWNGATLTVFFSTGAESAPVDNFVASTDTLSVTSDNAFSTAITTENYQLYLRDTSPYATAIADTEIDDIDFAAGRILFKSTQRRVVISYQAGFASIPFKLKQAAILLCKELLETNVGTSDIFKHLYGKAGGGENDRISDIKELLVQYRAPRL